MTYETRIRLVSRAFVLYLLFWLVTDVVYLPREFLTLAHAYHAAAVPREQASVEYTASLSYSLRLAVMNIAENVLRIALWAYAALWFYRCGPRIQRFFGLDVEPPSERADAGL